MVDRLGQPACPAAYLAAGLLIVAAVEDAAAGRIGNARILAVVVLALAARWNVGGGWEVLSGLLVGSGVWACCLGLAAADARAHGRMRIGGGDLKLLASLSILFGAAAIGPILVIASSAAAVGLACRNMLCPPAHRSWQVAFGPWLVISALTLWGAEQAAGRPWHSLVTP